MTRFLIYLSLIAIGSLVAGLYGALHDQISYTVSAEYFTKFKYRQFGLLDSNLPDRIKVGLIGFRATWWMGLLIALFVGALSIRQPSTKLIYRGTLKTFTLVALVALLLGSVGLIYGWNVASTEVSTYPGWFFPKDLSDAKSYIAVGHMHNAGYLGGMIGLLVGIVLQLIRLRTLQADR